MRIAVSQLNSGDDWKANLETVHHQIERASYRKAKAIFFPENCLFMGRHEDLAQVAREMKGNALKLVKEMAKENRIAVHLGSIPESIPRSRKVFNTSIFIDEYGKVLERYRKIHLFDVRTPKGLRISESSFIRPGNSLRVFSWQGVKIGLSICFDLRFPEHFRNLARRGAEWILVPSAFTSETGRAHWHPLLRARAIENWATVIASAQTGTHPDGRKTYGHSLVIEPWGKILRDSGKKPGPSILSLKDSYRRSRKLRKTFKVL